MKRVFRSKAIIILIVTAMLTSLFGVAAIGTVSAVSYPVDIFTNTQNFTFGTGSGTGTVNSNEGIGGNSTSFFTSSLSNPSFAIKINFSKVYESKSRRVCPAAF